MVDMTHDGDDGSARYQVFFMVGLFGLSDSFLHIGTDEVDLVAELAGHHGEGLSIETLVNGHRHTQSHAGGNDLGHRHTHHDSQVVGGNELRHLQDGLLLLGTHLFLHHAASHLLTFLTTVF